MLFTIITVCFNSEMTIERTIQSVLNQTCQDYEYIIIDGASTDGTMDIVRKYEPLFQGRMRWISEKDQGIYDAMNQAVEEAKGRFVFFLNCGMRLAELITINLGDFKDDTIKITGKGNKERLVYLNTACQAALEHYLPARAALNNLRDKEALFVSKKTGRRLTARRVEQIVANCLKSAGLDNMGYSPHKLRHTAATLMYQGGVDMLAIKEILGHENVSTTQIYTHINQQQLKQAVEASPLADTGYIAPQSKAMTDSKQDTGEENS